MSQQSESLPKIFSLISRDLCDSGCEDLFEFRCIDGKGGVERIFVPARNLEARWKKEVSARLKSLNSAGYNIYYGVNLRAGGDVVCSSCRVLWADLDYSRKDLVEKNLSPLVGYNIIPTIVVASGHGYHLYWALKEPVSHDEARPVLDTLARVLAGDHVSDPARLLRVPGFSNVKDPKDPVMCLEIRSNDRAYSLDDFHPLESVASGIGEKSPSARKEVQKVHLPSTYGNGHGFMHALSSAVSTFWSEGARHKICLGLAGLMRKDDVPEEVAVEVVQKICSMTGDSEVEDRISAVRSTYRISLDRVSAVRMIDEALGGETAHRFMTEYGKAIKLCPPPPLERPSLPDFDLYSAVPPGSLFDRYVQYAYEITDAPIQYHVAAIVTVAAGALGNRVFIPQFHGTKLFPNLYTMIAGPSSRFRKSTSINIAYQIAEGAKVPSYPNNATLEQLYARFAPNECEWREEPIRGGQTRKIPIAWEGKPWGIIYHREFASYLSASSRSYMHGHRDMLMDVYDGVSSRTQASRETKTSGRYYIYDPAISMLCAVTPASLKDFCTSTDIGNGFLSRFLVVMHPEKHVTRHEIYRPSPERVNEAYDITSRLTNLTQVTAEMEISREAEELWVEFDRWIHERIAEVEGTGLAVLDSFLARLSVMAVKIGMIYAWGTRLPAPEITGDDMRFAIGLCRYSANALRAFFDVVRPDDGNREYRYRRQVLDAARGIVRREGAGAISHRRLLQASNLDAEQFARAVKSLIEEGGLIQVTANSGRGRAYVLNER